MKSLYKVTVHNDNNLKRFRKVVFLLYLVTVIYEWNRKKFKLKKKKKTVGKESRLLLSENIS